MTLAFRRFLVQERLDADPPSFTAEMPAEGVGTGKAPATAPLATGAQLATADEFLLAGVEAFVAFAVVLAREGFAADGTDERALVGVGAEVGAEVVGTGEALGAEVALECGGVFLDALPVVARGGGTGGVG